MVHLLVRKKKDIKNRNIQNYVELEKERSMTNQYKKKNASVLKLIYHKWNGFRIRDISKISVDTALEYLP